MQNGHPSYLLLQDGKSLHRGASGNNANQAPPALSTKETQLNLSVSIGELLKAPNLPSMVAAALALSVPAATSKEAKVLYEHLSGHIDAWAPCMFCRALPNH